MARQKKKKIILKKTSGKNKTDGIFSEIKLTESYASLILGAIFVLIIGILFISFAKGIKNKQVSFVDDVSKMEKVNSQGSNASSTYTINPGDDLWNISVNFYHDGYKWVKIAKANKLENPGLIHPGNQLLIPSIAPIAVQKLDQTAQNQNLAIQNNSISGNTYIIKSGDNLWDIAVRAYGDGFKWPDIDRANSLENPDLIHAGNILKIPR